MLERNADIEEFLSAAGWKDTARQTLAGDLSNRKYTRLRSEKGTAILMDADTSMVPFLNMTRHLAQHGFSVPTVLAENGRNGLVLLEDFGDMSINTYLEKRDDPDQVDGLCVDLLLALRKTPKIDLPSPDAETLVDWTRLADTHYPGVDPNGLETFRTRLLDLLSDALSQPRTLSLRDFHADNMMWLSGRPGFKALGLLDYQDAFLTHPCYDLMSYLTDARTEVTNKRRDTVLKRYLACSHDNKTAFETAFAAFSAQRNLRILGIFTRSAEQGKPHHLPKLPRVYRYFSEALQHPIFEDVYSETLAALPRPETVIETFA